MACLDSGRIMWPKISPTWSITGGVWWPQGSCLPAPHITVPLLQYGVSRRVPGALIVSPVLYSSALPTNGQDDVGLHCEIRSLRSNHPPRWRRAKVVIHDKTCIPYMRRRIHSVELDPLYYALISTQ